MTRLEKSCQSLLSKETLMLSFFYCRGLIGGSSQCYVFFKEVFDELKFPNSVLIWASSKYLDGLVFLCLFCFLFWAELILQSLTPRNRVNVHITFHCLRLDRDERLWYIISILFLIWRWPPNTCLWQHLSLVSKLFLLFPQVFYSRNPYPCNISNGYLWHYVHLNLLNLSHLS